MIHDGIYSKQPMRSDKELKVDFQYKDDTNHEKIQIDQLSHNDHDCQK